MEGIKSLGQRVTKYTGLETFKPNPLTVHVIIVSDEVTAVCPVTGQPDQYIVSVDYVPVTGCIESKTFKLLLQSFRNVGMFCEELACRVAREVGDAVGGETKVVVTQKPRGGVSILAHSSYTPEKKS